MRYFKMKINFVLSISILLASPAAAEGWVSFEATTTASIEVRGAPGPYDPIATIPSKTKVVIGTCFFEGAWCEVTSADISGFADATFLKVGEQTVQEKYAAYWQGLKATSAKSQTAFTSTMIWTEGDSYMQGGYEISLSNLIADASYRHVEDTAKGGATMDEISARLQAEENNNLRPRTTIIWDGSFNGLKSVEEYVEQLQAGIAKLGHDHFVIIPPLHGGEPTRTAIAKEIKSRWPDNTIDWRDVLGDYDTTIPPDWLAKPNEDQVHLGLGTMRQIASAIAQFIQSKGW